VQQIAVIITKILGVYGTAILAILGFICVDRKVFVRCMYLLMLTMIYNTILKNIFQMPLPETCPTSGFGFPSGHFHFAAIFYIWVMVHYKNTYVRWACLALMAIYGTAVIQAGCHYPIDVISALGFAAVSVFLYKKFPVSPIFVALALCVILYIVIGKLESHIYLSLFFLIGLESGWRDILKENEEIQRNIFNFVVAFVLIIGAYHLVSFINNEIKWALIAISIPISILISDAIFRKKQNVN
jgi:hypothetical protein